MALDTVIVAVEKYTETGQKKARKRYEIVETPDATGDEAAAEPGEDR